MGTVFQAEVTAFEWLCGRKEHGKMSLLWPELRKLEIYSMQDAEIIIPES